jgi:hypothetical protein
VLPGESAGGREGKSTGKGGKGRGEYRERNTQIIYRIDTRRVGGGGAEYLNFSVTPHHQYQLPHLDNRVFLNILSLFTAGLRA